MLFSTEHCGLNRLLWASLGTLFPVKKTHSVLETNNNTKKCWEHDLFVEWGLLVQSHVSELKHTSIFFSNLDSLFFLFVFFFFKSQSGRESFESGHVGEPEKQTILILSSFF